MLLAFAAAAAVVATPVPCPEAGQPYKAGVVLVGLQPRVSVAERAKLRAAFRVTGERSMRYHNAWVFGLPCGTDVQDYCKRLRGYPGVVWAEPDMKIQIDKTLQNP